MMLPLLLGVIGFALAMFILSGGAEPPKRRVVQLLVDKNIGDVINSGDVRIVAIETQYTRQNAITRIEDAVGKIVLVPRQRGDILLATDVGESLPYSSGTRLVGLKVGLEEALGGLLKPGDRVTLIASIPLDSGGIGIGMGGQLYTRAFLDGIKVVYVPESFAPPAIAEQGKQESLGISIAVQRQQAQEGVIVLEVPIAPLPVVYAFPERDVLSIQPTSGITESITNALQQNKYTYEMRLVSPVEFIASLKATGAKFSLALIPPGAQGGEFLNHGSMGVVMDAYVPDRVKSMIPKTVVVGGEK